MIDSFIPPEILKFKEGSKRVQYVFDTRSTRFKRQYLWKEAINQIFVFRPNSDILRGIRQTKKKLSNCPFQNEEKENFTIELINFKMILKNQIKERLPITD